MQPTFPFGQPESLSAIRHRLRDEFGRIRLARLDPVGQFVRSFIGSRTYDETSWNVFWRLSERYRSWDAMADASEADIQTALDDVTHSEKKAPDLKRALRSIRARTGRIHLYFLHGLPVELALAWLEQIHGVGRKIAAATLNFSSLRKRAFVVDTHVLRVLRRFGFVAPNADTEEVYDAVMEAAEDFDADALYELHVYLKRLGQTACTHHQAFCDSCPLRETCLQRIEKSTL